MIGTPSLDHPAALGVGLVLGILATGMAGRAPDEREQEGFMSYDQMREEYDRTLENFPDNLPFPAGVNTHPPLESQTVTDPETTDLFQVGSGESQAYIYWALNSEFQRRYFEDPGRMWELEVLGGARTRDLSLMKDFAVGCDVDS